ncbi:MAG: UDP-N-acetylmuramoyl-tripeptide--D-alanyl-D-alanine ligase [Veillonellaceae bacterium]|nr:UDP-N-acetylmuramoyl-tripeptide--D-alanyl-D-alanine ligase [Veillonellaceae bacterium]
MACFSEEEIRRATGATLVSGSAARPTTSVATDSRTIAAGALFVALRGERFDGHDFVAKAVESGAAAVLVERAVDNLPANVAQWVVSDTLRALQDLARFHRRRFSIPVVAVTGSNGKTTTKEMIAAVLAEKYLVCKTEKNYNNEIGLPLTLLQLTEEHGACVVEMGMRGRGQIAELAAVAEPTVGVVTNVGVAHIEILGSQKEIAAAKQELIEALPETGTAVLNVDDPRVAEMAGVARCRVIGCGFQPSAMVRAIDVQYAEGRTKFTCRLFDEVFALTLQLLGEHNVYNALLAIAVGRVLGVNSRRIRQAFQNLSPEGQRQEVVRLGGIQFINDAYNANPVSLAMALKTLFQFGEGRKVAVLGDMLELGERARAFHREMGTAVAQVGVAVLLTVGDLAAEMIEPAAAAGVETHACRSTKEALAVLRELLHDGDIVLVKGSHSMHMENIITDWKEGNH